MQDFYLTIQSPAGGQLREKASRFLAYAYPVKTAEEAEQLLAALRKKYFDATHVCYAWRLGADGNSTKSSDDGEPAHTAGDPILHEIRARNLTQILIAVVRYYGGTKLGTGGLMQAYRGAAALALDQARIVREDLLSEVTFHYPYPLSSEVNRLIHQYQLKVLHTDFAESCTMTTGVKPSQKNALMENLKNMGIFVETGLP